MTELRINGFERVGKILSVLLPHLKFKKIQAMTLIKSARILQKKMSSSDKQKLVHNILIVQSENYATRNKRTKSELSKLLGLTP